MRKTPLAILLLLILIAAGTYAYFTIHLPQTIRERDRKRRVGQLMNLGFDEEQALEFDKKYSPYLEPGEKIYNIYNITHLKFAKMWKENSTVTDELFLLNNRSFKKTVNGDFDKDGMINCDELHYGKNPLLPQQLIEIELDKEKIIEFHQKYSQYFQCYNHTIVEFAKMWKENSTITDKLFLLNNCSFSRTINEDSDKDGVPILAEMCIYKTNPFKRENWNDFHTIIKILDTPEKILRYFLDFNFVNERSKGVKPPYETFLTKKVDCGDAAAFGTYILYYNGLDAWMFCVRIPAYKDWHAGTLLNLTDGYIVIDWLRFLKIGKESISPKFTTLKEAADWLAKYSGDYDQYILFRITDPYAEPPQPPRVG